MSSSKKNFLKLVWDSVADHTPKNASPRVQMDLFPHRENSIVIIYLSELNKDLFSKTIKDVHPSHVVDLRANPRFDIMGYSRRMAFSDFKSIDAKYIDSLELLGSGGRNKEQIVNVIEGDFISKLGRGPLAFILSKKKQDAIVEDELVRKLAEIKGKWSVSIVP